MGVYIKGMEMPISCDNCWALDDYGDYPRCRITEEQRGYNFPIREKRMDKCPLIPVPPHGRLIDETDIDTMLTDEYGWVALESSIEDAPTIIESEGEG